ncbi:MAG TPA: helix-turn-helix transcriptional regulator [Tepidisphaeraceae bacterium]|nr:helix-turn-helix transcriptional regulator [Tepidisphaeraceae bacterium]
MQTAVTYLRDNLARPIGVRDIAAQVNLSERHLARTFRAATGRSVLDYLTGLRVDAAAQMLLADVERPVKQIAATVGYPDVRYFTTLFGRHTGTTPAAYRAAGGTRHFTDRRHEQE